MATSNFHNVNASHIFAVQLEDTYEYDDLIDNIKSGLKETGEFNLLTKSDPEIERRLLWGLSNLLTEDRYIK